MIHKDEQPAAVDEAESEATLAAPSGSLLRWERRSEYRIRGYLVGHPETTLFLIVPANPSGEVHLQGAFVPDDEEAEVWAVSNAQAAAEKYMLDWLATCGREIAANDRISDRAGEAGCA